MKCSAVISTFNRRDYVLEAVRSVAEQSCPPYEIIVVVDGSTDGTAEAIRQAHPQVRVVEQPNLGRSVARNNGVAHATGDWVAFMDDDDLWHRDKLKVIADYIRAHPGCSAVNHWFYYFSENRSGPESGFGAKRDFVAKTLDECHQAAARAEVVNSFDYLDIAGRSHACMLERNRGALSASVVRRQITIAAGGFPASASYAEDWYFFLNVSRLTEWQTVRLPLGFQRLHPTQSTGQWQNGTVILAMKVAAWYAGRPLPGRTDDSGCRTALLAVASEYRREAQGIFWGSVFSGRLRSALTIWRLAGLLLPRWRDRCYVLTPPPVTWRFERYLLGMHK